MKEGLDQFEEDYNLESLIVDLKTRKCEEAKKRISASFNKDLGSLMKG